LPQVQSLQDWKNQVTALQDEQAENSLLSVSESTVTSSTETTRQLIELLEKVGGYFDVSVSL